METEVADAEMASALEREAAAAELGRWNELAPALIYHGINTVTRKWMEQRTYGGKLVENAVQAIARWGCWTHGDGPESSSRSRCPRIHLFYALLSFQAYRTFVESSFLLPHIPYHCT